MHGLCVYCCLFLSTSSADIYFSVKVPHSLACQSVLFVLFAFVYVIGVCNDFYFNVSTCGSNKTQEGKFSHPHSHDRHGDFFFLVAPDRT